MGGKSGSFTYDNNGNAISDGLRGVTGVNYFSEIDLPKQYYKDASNKVDYSYDATGNKWSKTATIAGTAATMSYYGQFVYQGSTLSKVLTSEGFYDPGLSLYHYYLKDHLGNTRITYYYSGTTPVIDQEEEYYPFGAMFAQNNLDKNTYLYNGKELNNEFFENYDYGARFYDPAIGRWHSVDPLAEKAYDWSPYRYAYNNPLKFIDIDGKIEWPIKGSSAVNKRDAENGGYNLKNTVIRTSTYLDTDRPPGASNPHIGIDYRASEGTSFYSLGDGKVTATGDSKKGGKYITVEYEGGDKVTFRHIKNVVSDLKTGSAVSEGQPLGETGKTGTAQAHLHIDAKDSDGNRIDPENKNYGIVTNKQFFETHGGDWSQLKKSKEDAINELNKAGNEIH